jgi:uncharacterized protein YecT (DUF1311 family)
MAGKQLGFALIAAAVLASAGAASAADPPSAGLSPCWKKAQTQADLDACAAADARAADERLNETYQRLLGDLDPEARSLLTAAQQRWITFRDADCAFWGSGEGSIAPMNAANCRATLSDDRTRELKGWPPNADPEDDAPAQGR